MYEYLLIIWVGNLKHKVCGFSQVISIKRLITARSRPPRTELDLCSERGVYLEIEKYVTTYFKQRCRNVHFRYMRSWERERERAPKKHVNEFSIGTYKVLNMYLLFTYGDIFICSCHRKTHHTWRKGETKRGDNYLLMPRVTRENFLACSVD